MKWSLILLLSATLLVVFAQFVLSNYHLLHTVSYDYHLFYIAGQKALQHQNPYLKYSGDWAPYTPPIIILFALFSLFPINTSQTLFFCLSFGSWIATSYILYRIIKQANILHETSYQLILFGLTYAILTLVFFPFRFTLGMGQVGLILLLFLSLTYFFIQTKKTVLASLFLALSVLLKISPLIFLLLLLAQKRYKIVTLTLTWILGLFAVSAFLLGPSIIPQYLSIPSHFLNFTNAIYYNQAFSGLLLRFGLSPVTTQYVDIFIASVALLPLGYILFKKGNLDNKEELIAWNVTLLIMLIFAPYAWQHHFVLLIFPFVTTFVILRSQKPMIYLYLLLALSYLFTTVNVKNPLTLQQQGLLGKIILSHILWGSIFLFIVNCYFFYMRSSIKLVKTSTSKRSRKEKAILIES